MSASLDSRSPVPELRGGERGADAEDLSGSAARPPEHRSSRRGGLWARVLGSSLILAIAVLSVGFLLVADKVTRARPPENPEADGIVALTGGPGRIEDAAELLGRGSADRMLISGVNQRTSAEALSERSAGVAGLIRCCIDLGYEARDTRGNAAEAAKWAQERGYRSLIVVTSAYHMPRSLAEMERVLPDVELVPYPIPPSDAEGPDWRSDLGLFRLLVSEYVKYIVARLA